MRNSVDYGIEPPEERESKKLKRLIKLVAKRETGNILASSFCDVIADFFQFYPLPSPLSCAFDMIVAVVENASVAVVAEAKEKAPTFLSNRGLMMKTIRKSTPIPLLPHQNGLKTRSGRPRGTVLRGYRKGD